MPFIDKERNNPEARPLMAQAWQLVLALMCFIRFWPIRHEALWLLGLDIDKGQDAVSLVQVSLARDGMLALFGVLLFSCGYVTVVIMYLNKRKNKSA